MEPGEGGERTCADQFFAYHGRTHRRDRIVSRDPFDCSGDDFSVPHYRRLLTKAGGWPLPAHFERNIRCAGLEDWIEVHQGRAEEIALG